MLHSTSRDVCNNMCYTSDCTYNYRYILQVSYPKRLFFECILFVHLIDISFPIIKFGSCRIGNHKNSCLNITDLKLSNL